LSIQKSDSQLFSKEFSITKSGIRLVGPEDFEEEVLKKKWPVLVLCIHNDLEIEGQIEVVKDVTAKAHAEKLDVCLLEDECIGIFREKYKVGGTPTFLIFDKGREIGRLLGQAETATLEEFLSRTLV